MESEDECEAHCQPGLEEARRRPEPAEADREILFGEMRPLINRLVRKYGERADDRHDLEGELFFRFNYLIEIYDPSRGVPLRPYLIRQLTASIHTHARKLWRIRQREVSSSGMYEVHSEGAMSHNVADAHDELVRQQLLDLIASEASELSSIQKRILVWRLYDGRSCEEIGEDLEMKVTTVRSNLRHAINNVRRGLAPHKYVARNPQQHI